MTSDFREHGKLVGKLDGKTLIKRGKQVILMRIFDGFGISWASAHHPRIEKVEIHYQGDVYRASTEQYRLHGIPYQRPPYEKQLVLPRQYFSVASGKQMELIR